MGVLFVGGVMNLLWIAGITLFCVPRKGIAFWGVGWATRWWRNAGDGAGRACLVTDGEELFVCPMCSL